jgi:hypothetical protein
MTAPVVTVAVEGDTDAAIVKRILDHLGIETGPVHVTNGKGRLDKQLNGFNHAARHGWWLVLRDLDQDAPCAPQLLQELLPQAAPKICLRIAVRAAEAWLLANHRPLSKFLAVSKDLLPKEPELVPNPKMELVNLARRSRSRAIREDMVPEPGSSIQVGPGYTTRLIEFASTLWQPDNAAERSDSLTRCLKALRNVLA